MRCTPALGVSAVELASGFLPAVDVDEDEDEFALAAAGSVINGFFDAQPTRAVAKTRHSTLAHAGARSELRGNICIGSLNRLSNYAKTLYDKADTLF